MTEQMCMKTRKNALTVNKIAQKKKKQRISRGIN